MTTEKSLAITPPMMLSEIVGMAAAFYKSGMFQDTKSEAQAIVKIIAGQELGLPPVYSMQNINMIRNRLASSANTMAMLVKRGGKYNYKITEHNDQVCTIEFFESGKSVGFSSFSMADAKRADLIKPDSGWMKYPRAMLFSRAISQGVRIYCPDAIGGMYTDEELRAIPAKPGEPDIPEDNPFTSSATVKQITDGEGVIEPPVPQATPKPVKPESGGTIGKDEISHIYELLAAHGMDNKALGKWMREEPRKWQEKNLGELTPWQYQQICDAFREPEERLL